MLSPQTRQRIEFICARIKAKADVAYEDMVWIQKWADRNPTVATWLRQARRAAFQEYEPTSLDEFCQAMDLGEPDPSDHLVGPQDPADLAAWFQNKRKWFRGDQ